MGPQNWYTIQMVFFFCGAGRNTFRNACSNTCVFLVVLFAFFGVGRIVGIRKEYGFSPLFLLPLLVLPLGFLYNRKKRTKKKKVKYSLAFSEFFLPCSLSLSLFFDFFLTFCGRAPFFNNFWWHPENMPP